MDRLTARKGNVVTYIGQHARYPITGDTPAEMSTAARREVLKRLEEYEITGTPTPAPQPAKPCPHCAPEVLRRGQYVKEKNIIGRWDDHTVLNYCWNCGRKIKEDK